ncbi:MAG: tyrosine-type recombinase/integrase [Treponema sp.]|nr:tyrosine-type recombinase/integrase [Treponema sp.]MCL2251908.1 tyrosine-type recombinase/integrase [Treponema sp.]
MNIIYLFCENNTVIIPFLGYNKEINKQITLLGGVWNDLYFGFILKQKVNLIQLKSLFDIVFIVSDKTQLNAVSAMQIKIYGLNKLSFYEENCSGFSKETDGSLKTGKENSLPEKLPEHLLYKLEFELRSRKLSLKTQKAYIYYNKLLCRTLQKFPEEIRPDDVTEFLAIMEKERKYSASSINLAISAIKFFFKYILKDNSIREQKRPDHNKILPVVLSAEEIIKILNMEKNPKHRLLLMLTYSSGLRVSEVVSLKKEHIDLSRQVIFIKQGKGRKDRYTILSEKVFLFIQEYYEHFKIEKWIFPGQSGKNHLSIRSAQHIFDKAARCAGITKKISIHGLRHTFATHLLENGTDIRYIQELLGHTNVRTTERYTHVAKRNILKIKSPLDSI